MQRNLKYFICLTVLFFSAQSAVAENVNSCATDYSIYLKRKNVFKAFATTGGIIPSPEQVGQYSCGSAGMATLEVTKTAAIQACELEGTKAAENRPCLVIDAKSRRNELAKHNCAFVQNWYRQAHPGYTVLVTTGGKPIDQSAAMGCSAQFATDDVSAKRVAVENCNKQSRLRGLIQTCQVIGSKH